MPSHYQTLQVIPTASDTVIKAAYRALAHVYHPDLNPDNVEAEALMQDINHAYQILSNTLSRAQYDIQNGFQDFYPDVVDSTYSAEPNARGHMHSTAEQSATHPVVAPKSLDQSQDLYQATYAMMHAPYWAQRLFFFVAAVLFILMALGKYMVNANPDLDLRASSNEAQELKLRLDASLLSIAE
jgi:DnaJ domain